MSLFAGDRPELGGKRWNTVEPMKPEDFKLLHRIQNPVPGDLLLQNPRRKTYFPRISNKDLPPKELLRPIPLRSRVESNFSRLSDLSLFRDQWEPKAFQSHLLDIQSNSTPDSLVKKKIKIDRSMVLHPIEKLPKLDMKRIKRSLGDLDEIDLRSSNHQWTLSECDNRKVCFTPRNRTSLSHITQ